MRDIRDDLLERLEATTAKLAGERTRYDVERRELEQRYSESLDKLRGQESALRLLLEDENASQGGEVVRPRAPAKALRLPLLDFIMNLLEDRVSMTKEEIKDAVEREGYVDSGESAGRMVHTTMINMVRSGKIINMADGQFELKHRDLQKRDLLGTRLSARALAALGHDKDPPAGDADEPSVFS